MGFARRRGEELDRIQDVLNQLWGLTPSELLQLMTGDTAGLEGKVDERLLQISAALGEVLSELHQYLTRELSAEDAAHARFLMRNSWSHL